MKKIILSFIIGLLLFVPAVPAVALLVEPVFINLPPQDLLLLIDGDWHELGNSFPPDELIGSQLEGDISTPSCPASDDSNVPNVIISIYNMTSTSWHELHYVADSDLPVITNYEGLIGDGGQSPGLAFKIDNLGLNMPLVSESINDDLIFEPGEIWHFILQDYSNPFGIDPGLFDSPGIGGASLDVLNSGGSIIAKPVPIPGSGMLLSFALLGLLTFGKQRKG
jgi:hypothetical protein